VPTGLSGHQSHSAGDNYNVLTASVQRSLLVALIPENTWDRRWSKERNTWFRQDRGCRSAGITSALFSLRGLPLRARRSEHEIWLAPPNFFLAFWQK